MSTVGRRFLSAIVTFGFAIMASPVFTQEPFPDFGQRFTQYSGNPLLTVESINPWNLPTPGEPFSSIPGAVHPDVLYFPEGKDGYKFWMVFTPFDGFSKAGPFTSPCPPFAAEECPPPPWSGPVQYWERVTLLRSNDGINWVKTGIDINPVISPVPGTGGLGGCEWDQGVHYDPDLVYAADKGPNGEDWFLYFAVSNTCGEKYPIGLALSEDGIHYEKYGPVIPRGATPAVVYDPACRFRKF